MSKRTPTTIYLLAVAAIALLAATASAYRYFYATKRMLVAPMIGGLDACLFEPEKLAQQYPAADYTKLCLQDKTSASMLINSTLDNISTQAPGSAAYDLGYTLYVPLLKLVQISEGRFEIDAAAVQRVTQTIANAQRPMILYLFSNHFSVGAAAEGVLATSEKNLLKTTKGTLPIDQYYGAKLYPWSFVQMDSDITKLRELALRAVVDAVCRLPKAAQAQVRGMTLLGEMHHLFPDFQGGMGFSADYQITDYSDQSVGDFRTFLRSRFKTIESLNANLGSAYSDWNEVLPPQKNIRTDKLKNYWEHIDAYAHGLLPISGWVARKNVKSSNGDWIQIYKNGAFVARTPVAFGRQDVLNAYPELKTPDLGWEYYYDFSRSGPEFLQFDIYLEQGAEPLLHLATRQVSTRDKTQVVPKQPGPVNLPNAMSAPVSLLFSVDLPVNSSTYYYNPLAGLWHEFRKLQISSYLTHFADLAGSKCIAPNLIYSHQILPFVNPGWDQTKYAVGSDLAVPSDMSLGVSLYGEASYGASFFDWFGSTKRRAYGVTEFHPLKPMNAVELRSVLDRHSENGAAFLSFFTESGSLDEKANGPKNIFAFDPNNRNAGSDVLYRSVQQILSK